MVSRGGDEKKLWNIIKIINLDILSLVMIIIKNAKDIHSVRKWKWLAQMIFLKIIQIYAIMPTVYKMTDSIQSPTNTRQTDFRFWKISVKIKI